MDIPFILRNYAGLLVARAMERVPSSLSWLSSSHSRLKPFVANWLQGQRFPQKLTRDFGGFRMSLQLSDQLQRQIYLGLYENEEIEWCQGLVRSGGTCIDVGANVGWFTLHFANWVGPTGRVIALEADGDIARQLTENCSLSQLADRVEVVRCAASDKVGTLRFARSVGASSGWGSAQIRADEANDLVEVPGTTLDEIVAERSLSDVDLLKIDVESHEFAVLAGASNSLGRKVFRSVIIEWEGHGQADNGRTISEMTSIFDAAGYWPSAHTIALLHSFENGSADPSSAFANLLYHRDPA